MTWRIGRKVGRTIYRMVSTEPSDDDELIGMMDTPDLAAEACRGRNALLGVPEGEQGVRLPSEDQDQP